MVNKKFWLGILVMVLVFGLTVIGCDDDSTDSGGSGGGGVSNDGSLDGTWNNAPMSLIISGSSYTSKYSGENYGKGTISYNGSTITLQSTHAWESSWVSFSETVTCNYSLSGNTLTISGIQGRYSNMNGVGTKE